MKKTYTRPSKAPRKQIVTADSIPSPVKGLNTRDPLAAMDPLYAIEITNFVCTPQGLSVREGFKKHAIGMASGTVRGLIPYKTVSITSNKLFAVDAAGDLYDVTNGGDVSSQTPALTALSGNEFRYTHFLTSVAQYVVCTNDIDGVFHFNGANWVQWTEVGSPTNPGQISGVSPSTLVTVTNHQRRLWFVQANSDTAWYLPVNAMGGAAVAFGFGPLFPRGGRLTALASWSIEGGDGMENVLVAISEKGDCVIYSGTDPAFSNSWALRGVWQLSPPANRNCFMNWGSDLLYLCEEGLISLSKYLQANTAKDAITDVIRPTISSLVNSQRNLPGWGLYEISSKNLLIINIPQISANNNFQLVYNTLTAGWSVFSGLAATSWAELNNEHYFSGPNGTVYQAFVNYLDNADVNGTNGNSFSASVQSAYNYFENRSKNKRFTMARLNTLTTSTNSGISISINTDFKEQDITNIVSPPQTAAATWDSALWDAAIWSGAFLNNNDWQTLSGIGYCGSLSVKMLVTGGTLWIASDIIYEDGGIIG